MSWIPEIHIRQEIKRVIGITIIGRGKRSTPLSPNLFISTRGSSGLNIHHVSSNFESGRMEVLSVRIGDGVRRKVYSSLLISP